MSALDQQKSPNELREDLTYLEGMLGHVGNSGTDAAFEKQIAHIKQQLEEDEDETVRIVWDYMRLTHDLESFATTPADAIICLGSSDLRAAGHAAELFARGLARRVVFTGGMGTGMHSGANLLGWTEPEAVIFAREAERCGVPAESILIESRATNTGENIRFSHALLQEQRSSAAAAAVGAGEGGGSAGAEGGGHGGGDVKSLILVTKPFMGRRAYATFMKQWPSEQKPRIACSSAAAQWPSYLNGSGLARSDVVGILLGDLQRVWRYADPSHGADFQIPQRVPTIVRAAFDLLVGTGRYSSNLLKRKETEPRPAADAAGAGKGQGRGSAEDRPSSAPVVVRPASAADVPGIKAMQKRLIAHERPLDPTISHTAEFYDDVEALLEEAATTLVLVAETSGGGGGGGSISSSSSSNSSSNSSSGSGSSGSGSSGSGGGGGGGDAAVAAPKALVGCCFGQVRPSNSWTDLPNGYGYVGMVYVAEEQRGKRIFGSMLGELEKWFKTAGGGVTQVRLEVYGRNTSAVKAYTRAGFRESILDMRKDI